MTVPHLNDPRNPKKIITAMSGGIDSGTAAAIITASGIDTEGVTYLLQPSAPGVEVCGGLSAIESARETARFLGINHRTIDVSADFSEKVLSRCWQDYSTGKTPNPCPLCNRYIKFEKLTEYAQSEGADGVATGHYARIVKEKNDFSLYRGADTEKDQSYFLFYLNRAILKHLFFPLGSLRKDEVRNLAGRFSLPALKQKESQDACFNLPGMDFGESLRSFFGAPIREGDFVDPEGNILGRHQGIHRYTIGQRKGTGVSLGKPAYVSSIRYPDGAVVISTHREDLYRKSFKVSGCNWFINAAETDKIRCQVQIRYRHKPVTGWVELSSGTENAVITMDEPQRAVTPGQAAVFYDNSKVLGGGWIQTYG
jgi:tRNA-uridine 2-sulfurtransferase